MGKYKEVFKRMEIKYLIDKIQYEELMAYLETIAKVDEYGLSRINNIYFDTPDYKLIRESIEKPLYKEKLRLRTYGKTDNDTNSFIEIKKKFDKVVYKRRISGKYLDTYDYLIGRGHNIKDSQVAREIEAFLHTYENLRPAVMISYDRIAMQGIDDPELRITFDSNIQWDTDTLDLREDNKGCQILEPNQYLMEIKVSKAMPFGLARKMSELGIFPVSFSKYGKAYAKIFNQSDLYNMSLEEVLD